MKTVTTFAAAAAVVMTALVAAPATAAPAELAPRAIVKESFTYFATLDSRQSAPSGNARGIGDLKVMRGTVTDISGNRVGTLTSVMRVVAPSPKKDAELRDTQLQIQLKGGQVFAQAVNEDPKIGYPKTLHIMSVTGGTGAYASARGTLLMRPVGNRYLLAYDLFIEKNLKTRSFSFTSTDDTAASGGVKDGLGDVSLLKATGASDSYVLIATTLDSLVDAVDMQVFTADGSLFARTIARSKSGKPQASTFAVLGGTGSLAGYRGDLTLSANARTITARLAAPTGGSKKLSWFEDNGRNPVTVGIPGGTFLGVEGTMLKAAGSKKKIGAYSASRIAYIEVGGVTPVLTMLEQDFSSATIIVTGITLGTGEGAVPVVRPVIGGTGDYVRAGGQISSVEQSAGVWRKTGRIWR